MQPVLQEHLLFAPDHSPLQIPQSNHYSDF